MQTDFKAAIAGNEIDLEQIARHFGITRNFKWEDFLVLGEDNLKGIVPNPEGKALYLFPFGAMVFTNLAVHECMDIAGYLQKTEKSIKPTDLFKYTDEYSILVDPEQEPACTNDIFIAQEPADYGREIVATILAKSVALEKIEADISRLLDETEEIVNYLHQGRFSVSDRQLAQLSAKILGYKLSTISYIMLLDKPDITWVNEDAATLFNEIGTLFELNERYKKVRLKIETLMDITEVFSGLAHARRGNILEWAVIILIAIEIVLSVLDMFIRH